jgi:hypothetical protein
LSVVRRIHVPLRRPDEIISHLGAAHHWKEGRSAKSLIDQWWSANALPPTIAAILDQAEEWRGSDLVDAYAERCTSLDDGRPSHSQSDLLAIVGNAKSLGILSIEAKVDEGFDKTVGEWLKAQSAGKMARLAKLCSLFKLDPADVSGLRYQLFHRTASAIIEARRYRSDRAAMIVQSWSPDANGFADYCEFFDAVGISGLSVGKLSPPLILDDVSIRTAWSAEA